MASGGLGRFAISLIALPAQLLTTVKDSLTTAELTQLTGSAKRMPNSVWGLKPSNPAFPVINEAPITVPYHSIIGDRGKGDCPNCTDGVVAYWSSHLDGAKSEQIVPGPHGSAELPQTIDELDRILKLHLGKSATQRRQQTVSIELAPNSGSPYVEHDTFDLRQPIQSDDANRMLGRNVQ